MTREDIVRMAREECPYTSDEMRGAFYEGFLKGSAAEREACADLCDQWNASHPEALAAAIRARSNNGKS